MPKGISAARYLIHKACAYPIVICWAVGTLCIWVPLYMGLARSGSFQFLLNDWTTIPLLLVGYAASSGLGFFAGAFFLPWLVLPICRHANGTPHKIGETVLILSGPHSGRMGRIYAVATGQGGQPLPRVDLGEDARENFGDLFEDYALLEIRSRLFA